MPETSILEAPSLPNARFRAVSLRAEHAEDVSDRPDAGDHEIGEARSAPTRTRVLSQTASQPPQPAHEFREAPETFRTLAGKARARVGDNEVAAARVC